MMAVANGSTTACYPPMASSSNGAWQGDNPLDYALPLAILQICLVVVVTRSLGFMLRPLRQPRVVAEILGGILLGPSALGRSQTFLDNVFPDRSLTVLDTLADIGLVFFLFLVGLELDLRALRRTGKGALLIALAGISLPFVLGVGTSAVLRATIAKEAPQASFLVFIGVALSITAFPVLARILAELKLLSTDVGRMALSAAAVNDIAAWILLALAIALSGSGSPLISLWVLLSGFAFVAAVAVFVRPMLGWMAGRTIQGEPIKEQYVCATLALVLAAGFATDAIGIHALFGAFVVGVMVPKEGPFAGVLIEKLEDFVCSLFLPLYFVSSGLKTNVATISGGESWALLILVIATACLGKIGGTVIASLIAGVPRHEALTLGFLMNTKGLVELIVLNIGKDRKVLNDETFAILVLMALFNTFITTPVVMAIYKPARRAEPYKRHTIERRNGADSELRILACFHNSRSIPTLINLVESSRGAQQQGITVYAMHLMERSERPSAIYMVNKARHNGLPFCYSTASSTSGDHVVVYFETYKRLSHVTLRPMTAISDLQTIHKDIIESAEHKRAALIVLPFHKVMQIDGSLESLGQTYRRVNQRVLDQATCSVAILLDRGFGGAAQVSARDVSYTIAVLFFGGPDDREALAYGARMAEHPGIALYVIHFVTLARRTGGSVGVTINNDKHHVADETAISEFRTKVVASNRSITLQEREVETSADIVAVIKGMARCNLFLVGRCSPAMALMDTASADPELGPVGCYLASPGFSTTASVLIIQQYNPKANPAQLKTDDIEAHNKPASNGTTATASTSVVLS